MMKQTKLQISISTTMKNALYYLIEILHMIHEISKTATRVNTKQLMNLACNMKKHIKLMWIYVIQGVPHVPIVDDRSALKKLENMTRFSLCFNAAFSMLVTRIPEHRSYNSRTSIGIKLCRYRQFLEHCTKLCSYNCLWCRYYAIYLWARIVCIIEKVRLGDHAWPIYNAAQIG